MDLWIGAVGGLVLGGLVVIIYWRVLTKLRDQELKQEVSRIINRAKNDAAKLEREMRVKLKDQEQKHRKNLEAEWHRQKSEWQKKEQALQRRLKEIEADEQRNRSLIQKEQEKLEGQKKWLESAETQILEKKKRVESELLKVQEQVLKVSQLSKEEAKNILLEMVREESKEEISKELSKWEEVWREEENIKAQRVLAAAMSRMASEFVSERTVSVINLESEELKGKIIGREGRNIRTIEASCGVDLVVDDAPEVVVISSFDPIRRELAKCALEKLLEDGRVHPARIEEVVEKERIQIFKRMRAEGEKTVEELDIGRVHPELLQLIGSMKYRQTLSQSLLLHSLEVAALSAQMAAELGVDQKLAKRAGFLHDIGKCVDHTVLGSHAKVGADLCHKLGESEEVVHAIRAHHEEEPIKTALAYIVLTANLISNSRKGARKVGIDNYIKRHAEIESISNGFDGVSRSYAVKGGKELRVLVEADRISDESSKVLVRDILKKIDRELPHVSPIRISVVRETRAVEYAR